jgi:hypothetical protein
MATFFAQLPDGDGPSQWFTKWQLFCCSRTEATFVRQMAEPRFFCGGLAVLAQPWLPEEDKAASPMENAASIALALRRGS